MSIRSILFAMLALASTAMQAKTDKDSINAQSTADEVIWVVGDEAILKSDVEAMRMQALQQGVHWTGNPDCAIPEQIAVQKLFLHQAAIDSIEVTDAQISAGVDRQIDYMISVVGSREKLEEYHKKTMTQIRNELRDSYRENQMVEEMKQQLVKDIAVTPAEVRRYFKDLPTDSIPFVPTEVEVQIITQTPRVSQEEINRVKGELRDYTDRINRGDASFQTLARLYSEDPESARRGGELGFMSRMELDPAFAAVAFNLTDPKKVSKIVESEFGFHIIQLIEKRGEKANVRHILRRPVVSNEAIEKSLSQLDSLRTDIADAKFTFDQAASVLSDDKDTRNNKGVMFHDDMGTRTSRFQLQDLPAEVARAIDGLKIGEVTKPFQMMKNGRTVCAIVKLKNRSEGHKATITEDFQVMKNVVLEKLRQEKIHQWVVEKIKNTYVRINDRYRDCDFEYQGWIR